MRTRWPISDPFWRAQVAPWWVRAFTTLVIVPADVLMSHDMLHGLKQRAERSGPPGTTRELSPPPHLERVSSG